MKTESKENLVPKDGNKDEENTGQVLDFKMQANTSDEYVLTEIEKKFLLSAEHGDCATVER